MWERFTNSGLAGTCVDELRAVGIEARMEFRPRRAMDPMPFLVVSEEEDDGLPAPTGLLTTIVADRASTTR